MTVKLDQVVPFGRSLDEYRLMFGLTQTDLSKRILGCADGPASFNAELYSRGINITSIDPLYRYAGAEIAQRFEDCFETVFSQVRETTDHFQWDYHRDPDDLLSNRRRALELFARDFEQGREEGRYLVAALPDLPFTGNSFDLALCSHFLFLYTEHFSLEFHIQSVKELLRVAGEARIFPVLTLAGDRSPYLEPMRDYFNTSGCVAHIVQVEYELQKGGNEMLQIRRD